MAMIGWMILPSRTTYYERKRMKAKLKTYSLILLSGILGASIYDLAINLKISYNEREPKTICQKGFAFEQIDISSQVYLKTKKECINE